jgi:hypothetical protein
MPSAFLSIMSLKKGCSSTQRYICFLAGFVCSDYYGFMIFFGKKKNRKKKRKIWGRY